MIGGRKVIASPRREGYTEWTCAIPMDLATKVLDLAGQVYDCVERPELWPATVAAIADSVGSSLTGFSVVDLCGHANRVGINHGSYDAEADLRRYEDYYARLNVHNLHARRARMVFLPGTLVNSWEWGINDELVRSEYYNDFLRPLNAFHFLSGVVAHDDSCLSVFNCYRPHEIWPEGRVVPAMGGS